MLKKYNIIYIMRKGTSLIRPIIRNYTTHTKLHILPINWKEMTPSQKIVLIDKLETQKYLDIDYKNNDIIPSIIELENNNNKTLDDEDLLVNYYNMLLDSNEVIEEYDYKLDEVYTSLQEDYINNKKGGRKRKSRRNKRKGGKTKKNRRR